MTLVPVVCQQFPKIRLGADYLSVRRNGAVCFEYARNFSVSLGPNLRIYGT